jgi:type I restriction enzyme S subunit
MAKLGELASFVMGQAPPGSECNFDGKGTPFVKAGEFSDRTPIIREWTTSPLKLASSQDVLVCVVGATSGKINLGIDCAIGRSVAAVRPDRKLLDQRYLYHFLLTRTERLRGRSQGVAQGVITRDMLAEMDLDLPPLPEQRRIADILDKADAIRRKRQQARDSVPVLVDSLFADMFGDIPSKRSPYPVKALREWLHSANGKSSRDILSHEESGIPIYGGNGTNGWATRALYQEPVIVIGRVGQQCGITHVTTGPAWITDNAIAVRIIDQSKLDFVYLAAALKRSTLGHDVRYIDLPYINQSMILDLPLPLPPLKKQQEFARLSAVSWKSHDRLGLAYQETDQLFNSLVQRAFRGEL